MESQLTISSIVFIVCLIVPGVIFKRFYYQGQFTKQFGVGPFADRLITSIFWGIFVQIITFLIYSRSLGFTYTSIKNNIDAVYSEISKNLLPNVTHTHLTYILGYLVLSVVLSAGLGTFLHKLIRIFKVDIHFEVFRFANEWNYYFKGEILSTREFKEAKKGKVISTSVDLLIDDNTEKNKMVSGFLTQYTLSNKTGELETIYLTNARRYSTSTKTFKNIPGDCFIVPYSKVIDLNLNYNIIQINEDKKKQLIYGLISTIGFLGFMFFLVYPWFLSISIFSKVLGLIFSTLSWLLLTVVSLNPFQANNNLKLKGKALIVAYITMITLAIVSILFFRLIPVFNRIVSFK